MLAQFIHSNAEVGDVLKQVQPWLDGIVKFHSTSLSGLLMKGRDIADLPKELLPHYQRAAMALNAVRSGFVAIASTIREDRSLLRADMIRAQWREFGKMTTCIQRLQAQLAKSAGVGEEELTLLVDAFAVEAATDVATVALDSKRLEAAAAVVKAHTIDRSGR